jgi:hypothetical protein
MGREGNLHVEPGREWIDSPHARPEAGSVYCFFGPAEVLEGVNPANFRFGPQFINQWLPVASSSGIPDCTSASR